MREQKKKDEEFGKKMGAAKDEVDAQRRLITKAGNAIKRAQDKMKSTNLEPKALAILKEQIANLKGDLKDYEAMKKEKMTIYNKITQEKVAAVKEREKKAGEEKEANMFKNTEREVNRIQNKTTTLNKQLATYERLLQKD